MGMPLPPEAPKPEIPETYRCFTVQEQDEVIAILEILPKTSHPVNWMHPEYTRENAWHYVQARGKRVVFVGLDSAEEENFGVVFSPVAFEHAAYQGYVAYGLSMTDGHYTPEYFEYWIKRFRLSPTQHLTQNNDAPESVKAALPQYQAALSTLRASGKL